MAYFDTGQDLLRHLLRRVGQILPTETSEAGADRLIDASLYVNEAHWWVLAQRPWRFGRKDPPLQFVSVAEQLVTVNSIAGSAVTLSAAIATSMAGRKLLLDAEGIPHRIAAHPGGTAAVTLVTSYTGEQTSGAGRIFQDELTVAADILAWPNITELQGGDVELVPEGMLRDLHPRNVSSGDRTKRYAAFITDSKLRIAPWTSTARLFEVAYNYRPSPLTLDGVAGTDTPVVPRNFRQIIAWRAEERVAHDRRDKEREKTAKDEVAEVLALMERAELGFARPRSYVPRGHRVSG